MPEDLWQALQAESERTGQSTPELIREAVALRLAFVPFERAAAAGKTSARRSLRCCVASAHKVTGAPWSRLEGVEETRRGARGAMSTIAERGRLCPPVD